jgi:hypothetical protein
VSVHKAFIKAFIGRRQCRGASCACSVACRGRRPKTTHARAVPLAAERRGTVHTDRLMRSSFCRAHALLAARARAVHHAPRGAKRSARARRKVEKPNDRRVRAWVSVARKESGDARALAPALALAGRVSRRGWTPRTGLPSGSLEGALSAHKRSQVGSAPGHVDGETSAVRASQPANRSWRACTRGWALREAQSSLRNNTGGAPL